MHARCAYSLVVHENLAVGELDVTGIECVLVLEYSHQPILTARFKGAAHGLVIARQVRIAIDDKERIGEQWTRLPESPRRSKQRRAIKGILDVQIECAPIGYVVANLFPEMTDTQNHPADLAPTQ